MEKGNQTTTLRLIKLAISLAFFCFSFLGDLILRLTRQPLPTRCVILYYHCVPCEQRTRFARQMDVLVQSAKPIRADIISPLCIGQRYAAVTFDDAFESVLLNALPELEKRGIPATIFVIADLMGRSPGWEGYWEGTMTLDELRRLPIDLVTIGSHTISHRALPLLDEEEARVELLQSRRRLEELLNRKISLFSFPFGAFD